MQVSPFSAYVKKSLVKDKSGCSIPPNTFIQSSSATVISCYVIGKNEDLQQDISEFQRKQTALMKELSAAYEHLNVLRQIIKDCDETIAALENETRCAREAASMITELRLRKKGWKLMTNSMLN